MACKEIKVAKKKKKNNGTYVLPYVSLIINK